MGHWDALLEALSELPAAIVDGPMTLKFPRIPWLFRVIGWPFLIPSQILGIGIQNQEHQNLKRVATFYPDSWPTEPTMVAGLAFVVAISLAFGGIHFLILLWVVTAPSSTVISLWLVASISSVVVPVTLFLSIVIIWKRKFPHVPRIFELILGLQLGLYILHRLVLLILPFWDVAVLDYYTPDSDLNPFRFFGDGVLDPDVFSVVPWASYIPHV
ncbi:hypothetical protein BC827DRAFT_1197006 [Russula dissimulans]|nr:hypothetical protein BC827DRAFT_1197006 [Russula dissimulans]